MVQRVNYNDLDDDEWGIFYWKGKPFTGIAYEQYPNGQMLSEVEMIDGIANGFSKTWYSSGKLESEAFGKLSERDGWRREWFENGNLKYELRCELGFRVMEKFWNEQGELISEYEQPPIDKK